MGDKGTNDSEWFILKEAECVDDLDAFDEIFEKSTDGSNISQLIDDGDVDAEDEGNSLALYHRQVTEECDTALQALKRKYVSPQHSIADLSPKLQEIHISPRKPSKRRLFVDSGIEEDEAENSIEQVPTEVVDAENVAGKNGAALANLDLLRSNNRKATALAKIKDLFGVPYNELVRNFKSDKSCNVSWVIVVLNAMDEVLEASKITLQQHCNFIQLIISGFSGLYLVEFKSGKSRETVIKLMCTLMNVQEWQIVCDPPKIKSVATALFFYKKSIANASYNFGVTPNWLAQQMLVDHQMAAAAENFSLSQMVQWAWDNDLTDEPEIAYQYALCAETDTNATAFLNSNNQVKYVKDCSYMVKQYRRQQMRNMSISEWIFDCCDRCKMPGDYKPIVNFLKYQQVNFIQFLIIFKTFLQGIPKKNCFVLYGPPDSGKSYFAFSFMRFVRGRVVSLLNRNSQFFLQPLLEAKVGFMDDVTFPAWQYMDLNMRNALDGNLMSVDAKHRAPIQFKLPPLMVTTNIDVKAEISLKYLHSRVQCLEFPNKMLFNDDGVPTYEITDAAWTCFFRKFARQLDLQEEEANGEPRVPDRAFCCTARKTNDNL
ncbi:E1 [Gammapapillomavirus 19]|uniref:Replication protein E1 n=2 Tax=Papillomaviridae TaxID=151340 RepID=A0A451G3H8_9PAPI|nr:E1 [Gammapapillomavirus 19]QAB13964.1 MAG: E1 protein [Human papillomavirus]